MTDGGDQPLVGCPQCGTAGPPGSYCASCGAQFGRAHRFGLRPIRGYPVAPDEQVLSPWLVTSLFPRLATRARRPFRIALVAILLALVVFAVLRWQAPVVAVAVLGFAVLFVVYLAESDVFRDFPRRILALTAIVGLTVGAAWGAIVGQMVSRSYDVPLGSGMQTEHVAPQGMALAAAGALLMLVPAVIVAVLRPPLRESLDGYVIGALGAVCFTVAATVVRLAPQLTAGPTTDERSVAALLVEAGMQGVAVPLMAAGAGGLFGIALWFRSRSGGGVQAWVVLAAAVVAMVLYAVKRLLDLFVVGQWAQLLVHLVLAVLALLAARIGARTALLYEALDAADPAESFACPDCGGGEPGARFCVSCGMALRAFSRSARNAGPDARPATARATRRRLLAVGAGLSVVSVVALGVSALMTPPDERYVCPPDCGAPPMGTPVMTNPQFTSAGGDFSVSYPGRGTAYRPTFNPNGVVLDFTGGDTGTLELHGEDAAGRDAQRVADDLLRRSYPDAVVEYEIPNASVGYQPGYGVVADDYPQDGMGTYTRLRILLMVAVKNDYALVASAVGPYHEFSPSFGNGHPSGANLQLALDMAKYVNSFAWRGDAPR
jgi:hypothetical protein